MYCGIDISAATIDICFQTIDNIFIHEKLSNDRAGFTQLLKLTGKHYHFVMEMKRSEIHESK